MANYLNQDNVKFLNYYNDDIFIDKSLLIKVLNSFFNKESKKYMCITRPRRFGKTMALSMLNAYYSKGANSKELFNSLKISQEPNYIDHLNKHNVIWIDMASLYSNINNKDKFLMELTERIIKDLDESYPNVLTENEKTIADSLRKIYNDTKETFIFLIDEWDVIFRESTNNKLKDDYIMLLRSLFKASDTSTCIDLVYMTGILPIKKDTTQSALNNFKEYTMLSSKPLSEYMGFTKDEVIGLCDKYNMDYKEMKRWYDGYTLNGVELYNPKSVVEAITEQDYNNYWISTSAIESVNNYIKYQDGNLYDELLNLINGKLEDVSVSRFNNDIHDIRTRNAALTLLIHLGYLTYNGEGECRIPNYEVKNEMIKNLAELKGSPYNKLINLSNESIRGLFSGKTELIDRALTSNHKLLASSFNK